jgi:RHS repeat-associated protein
VASRLTSETITGDPSGASGNGALTCNVDPAGNRSSRASTLASLGLQSFSYDANDELTTDSYDPNGNTTGSGGHYYAYDFENRLVSKDAGAVTIAYDGDGNRVAKTVGGVTTKYLVDEMNPTGYLQVMDEVSVGTVQVRYTFGNMLVSQTRNPSTSPATSVYGYDAHGNVTFLTDGTGTVTDTYMYDAWGSLVAGTGSTSNTRLFVGEELDSDLGLINMRARQYKPATGRFLTIDPVLGRTSSPLSFNRFLYGNADPVNHSDPSGRVVGVEERTLVAAVAALLLAEATVIIGRNGHFTTVHTNTIGAVGTKTECNFATQIPWTAAPTVALADVEVCEEPPYKLIPDHRPDQCEYDCGDGYRWSIPIQVKCPDELTKEQILSYAQ